ncbi:diguanylate cyclase [Sediminibacillus dalangtanensis]|uniref:Diguanylate cyclase n=1 Tax=Sediminibacillus dalangtanensis TaxID=2729421 RepID=A0ABX7VX72_9BACI|nr:sensor domain-containing diguanylate cyclase [Sediminibacillus dalangtanensis]QTN00094.1 diguanylate cyclase [Sediminibacillus dalangtanensis]
MDINNRLSRCESWYRMLDTFMQENTPSIDEVMTKICEKIKQFIPVQYVGIYYYDAWKNGYSLKTDDPVVGKMTVEILPASIVAKDNPREAGKELFVSPSSLQTMLIPLRDKEKKVGFLFTAADFFSEWCRQECNTIAEEISGQLRVLSNYIHTAKTNYNHQILYQVTSSFHASINTKEVLEEVITTLKDVYPGFDYYLYLSQEFPGADDLPTKELIYNDNVTNRVSVHAFLTGDVQYEQLADNCESNLYIPLRGKQGVYGVLQICASTVTTFPAEDVEFISLLANEAGNAMENARLYQQSKQLIEDLQLINETSHTLNSNLRLIETTTFMNRQIKDKFGAEEIGFILFKEDSQEEYEVLDGSTDYFLSRKAKPFLTNTLELLKKQHDAVFIGDFSIKYPEIRLPYHSVMAIPMVQSKQIKGAIFVLHPDAYYFSFEAFKLIQSLVHHSTLAFVNSMLREQLEHLVITDYLTSLYSRKYLDERLQEHLSEDEQGAFLLIDIDDFKKFNDTYGHELGDELIIQVATIIKGHIGAEDFAARWGGEELAVYLPNASIEDGMETAHQLVKQVEAFTEPTVTISVGVSYWNKGQDQHSGNVFDRADEALYQAKELGKNCVVKAKCIGEPK